MLQFLVSIIISLIVKFPFKRSNKGMKRWMWVFCNICQYLCQFYSCQETYAQNIFMHSFWNINGFIHFWDVSAPFFKWTKIFIVIDMVLFGSDGPKYRWLVFSVSSIIWCCCLHCTSSHSNKVTCTLKFRGSL